MQTDDQMARAIASWCCGDDAMESVETPDQEQAREQRWQDYIAHTQEFAAGERDGWAAVLRAVAAAMKEQQEQLR